MLNKARDDAGKLAQSSLQDTNNVVRMVTAGSKGSFINISQARSSDGTPTLLAAHMVWPLVMTYDKGHTVSRDVCRHVCAMY